MLILVPIILLLLFAGGLNLFSSRYKLSLGTSWLFAAAAAIIVWILMIVFRVAMPEGIAITNWSPQGIGTDSLIFKLSDRTWNFAFLLISLLVGVIFTDTVRLGQGNNLIIWTGAMVLTAVGLLSIYSQTFLAVIITWTLIDIVEFGFLIRVTDHPKVHGAVLLEFITRVIGSFMVLAALVISKSHSAIIDHAQFSSGAYLLILFGATLRLGVFPMHLPLTSNLPHRRSLGTILRFVAPLSVVAFLAQIQAQWQYSTLTNFLFVIALIVGLYGAIKWVSSQNELSGRPFWMLSFSGLIITWFLLGQVEGIIGLSILMLSAGGFLFLYSFSSKVNQFTAMILALGLIGFPFTPTASIWGTLGNSQNWMSSFIIIISISLLFLGFLKHTIRNREQTSPKEGWMKLFYTTGLILLVICPWITMIWRFRIIQVDENWGYPIFCIVLIAIMIFIFRKRIWDWLVEKPFIHRLLVPFKLIGKILHIFFQFEWFFFLLRKMGDFISVPLKFFANLLEGDGGLLWALVFLAFISSILIGDLLP